MYLEKIDNPSDLKKLNIDECAGLANEIRCALLTTVSKTGGHLASNLGVVEVTIAMHYVFDSPQDKIVFDTSHQCYTHKILTGRKEAFLNPEKYKKYSGYTNPEESEHDYVQIGHTSTSISFACGLAKARNLRCGSENIVALIGDGSLGGGQALEGLNCGGSEIEGNFIIIFNDNDMSIAENHGGIYKSLKLLRESEGKAENNIFKFFGYDYIFVKEGNDVHKLISVLQKIKNIDHPIVVHICTEKGKGYEWAEKNREEAHFVKSFDLEAGIKTNKILGERYDIIVRDYLLNKMKTDPTVAVLTAAMPVVLSFSEEKRQEAGKQYIDVGIAEQHAISMAGGIAQNGGKPVFCTRSTFYQRAYDQISQELCINKLAVTMILINASIYAPTDVTHMGLFDIPMLSNIPNLVFLAPTNKQEYLAMLDWSIEQKEHPVAIRAPRNGVFYAKDAVDTDYGELNKYKLTMEGRGIAVIAVGDFYQMGEEVAAAIQVKLHVKPTLINPRYITGIDEELLLALEQEHKLVVTLEDGVLDGGFGQKIAGYYSKSHMRVMNYGFKKEFFDYYDVKAALIENRLSPELIVEDIWRVWEQL